MTEIRFIDPEFDGFEDELGGLEAKLCNVVDNAALSKYGKQFVANPTDIEVVPSSALDGADANFILRAWHETEGPAGKIGIFQAHDTSFEVLIEKEDALMHTEKGVKLPVTSRELLVLLTIAGTAIMKSLITTQDPRSEGLE